MYSGTVTVIVKYTCNSVICSVVCMWSPALPLQILCAAPAAWPDLPGLTDSDCGREEGGQTGWCLHESGAPPRGHCEGVHVHVHACTTKLLLLYSAFHDHLWMRVWLMNLIRDETIVREFEYMYMYITLSFILSEAVLCYVISVFIFMYTVYTFMVT